METVALELGNGRQILVEVVSHGDQEVGAADFPLADIQQSIVDVADIVVSVMEQIAPKSATVEFGVSVAVQAGNLIALLVQGTGSANLKITLAWEKERADADRKPD
jgi:hypothetical protein